MNYYEDVYLNRLNKYGDNFKDRIQGQRIADFNRYKTFSTYMVEFLYENEEKTGTLEPSKQDNTETLQWLLTDIELQIPGGTILEIDGTQWMILYIKNTRSKGYNKYLVLKMTHQITWFDRNKEKHTSWAFFFGKMDRIIYDVIRSTAKNPNYQEPNKETHLIMPRNENLKREDYIYIDNEGYIITGYDYNSTPGVEYFSLKETYVRTTSPDRPSGISDQRDWLEGTI